MKDSKFGIPADTVSSPKASIVTEEPVSDVRETQKKMQSNGPRSQPCKVSVVLALTIQAAHDDGQAWIEQDYDYDHDNHHNADIDMSSGKSVPLGDKDIEYTRLSKFDGDSFIRFIDEPWTADAFLECQSQIPPDAKQLAFILYADKAKLLSFGREKGYPVIAHLANHPVAIRNGNGVGGGRVVGWFPLIKDDPKYRAVWHMAFKKVLASIVPPSTSGRWANCWDNIARFFYTLVLILSADYEKHKYEVIFKSYMPLNQLLTFAAHAVLPNAGESKLAYLLLRCICAYLKVDRYTALEVHTTKTIAAGREALQEFSELISLKLYDLIRAGPSRRSI
ncbi:hypothetical protein EV702DRAFT_1046157 [Suillus placidus]|uniref:Uncharacterized protein n=1 Tax=Suillus placidus TaxID=48579 RepID=A0A9P7D204_9AGAM|nr:hypothetical protein EV702DRAFT_1046157 [Suillus placidus]